MTWQCHKCVTCLALCFRTPFWVIAFIFVFEYFHSLKILNLILRKLCDSFFTWNACSSPEMLVLLFFIWNACFSSEMLFYAFPSSDAYSDRQVTPKFELWLEIFCVPTCFHVWIPKSYLSVRGPWSVRSKWYINGKVFTSTTTWKSKKKLIFSLKKYGNWVLTCILSLWLVPKCWNHTGFVNICPTVVIGTWMETFSRVLHHGNKNKFIFFKKAYLSVSAVMFCK